MSTSLFVSRSGMDCEEVANMLVALGVVGNVTPNYTVHRDRAGSAFRETGCRVRLCAEDPKRVVAAVWNPLRSAYSLSCAFVSSPTFRGCVHDYLAETKCPGFPPPDASSKR